MSSLKCTALEKVGVPGMLDGRRRDVGRRAGLTSSPDFFRRRGGFIRNSPSSTSLSSEELMRVASVLMVGNVLGQNNLAGRARVGDFPGLWCQGSRASRRIQRHSRRRQRNNLVVTDGRAGSLQVDVLQGLVELFEVAQVPTALFVIGGIRGRCDRT